MMWEFRRPKDLGYVIAVLLTVLSWATPSRGFFGTTSPVFQVNFYGQSCPGAESTVRSMIAAQFKADLTSAAPLLRMFFHDCFVTGCDGSLLINSTKFNRAEKDASPNLTIRGYGIIDNIKKALERLCPRIVSCADILALAAREALVQVGGPFIPIPTGRRDGSVSVLQQALNTLPSPALSVSSAAQAFASQGFSTEDMVVLLGAHTVGATFCQFFSYRLYNFGNTNQADPTMDPQLVTRLRIQCPVGDLNTPVALDQSTINTFDSTFFLQLLQGHGVLQLDQELAIDSQTSSYVSRLAGQSSGGQPAMNFASSFSQSFLKLSTLNVLVGNRGGIRTNCAIAS